MAFKKDDPEISNEIKENSKNNIKEIKELSVLYWEYTQDIEESTEVDKAYLEIKGHYKSAIQGDVKEQGLLYQKLKDYWLSVENYTMVDKIHKRQQAYCEKLNLDI